MANDLLQQALIDAKKVRATAMANAKAALEETLTPRIQEMIRMKLSEQEEIEESEELEEAEVTEVAGEVNEQSLDEILAELEMEESALKTENENSLEEAELEESELEEAKKKDDEPKEEEPAEEEEESEEGESEEGEEGEESGAEGMAGEEEKEVIELTIDEFKQMIRDAIAEANGGSAGEQDPLSMEPDAATDLGGGAGEEELEEINLDSVLAELEEETPVALQENRRNRRKISKTTKTNRETILEKKLQESVKALNTMKSEVNEINLLNAKLLYVNKIFKEKTLSENQKVRIVEAFDNVNTVVEAKKVYEKLKSTKKSSIRSNRSAIKESVGFASKPIGGNGSKPAAIIDPTVERFQRLAGIIKD